jgi:hypothetical protein
MGKLLKEKSFWKQTKSMKWFFVGKKMLENESFIVLICHV